MDLSHQPVVLYHGSLERMEESHRAFDQRHYVLCAYLSGLAVECVLQAVAFSHGARHDARHDLNSWLKKCPDSLQDAIEGNGAAPWSYLLAMWDNGLRYYSVDGYLGYLRQKKGNQGVAGGNPTLHEAD